MKTVGFVLPFGQSKKLLEQSGQWALWESELDTYRKLGWRHELFQYRFGGPLRFIEALFLPFLDRKRFLKCDVLQSVHLGGVVPCLLARILYGKPFVLRYAYRYDEFARIEKKWFQRVATRLMTPLVCGVASAIIVPTKTIARFVKQNGGKRIVIIPNGVDTTLFHPDSKAALKGLTLPKQGQTLIQSLLSVGRLEPQKNFAALIDAVSRLQLVKGLSSQMRRQSFRIDLIGQGSMQRELLDQAERQHVDLTIHRSIPNDQLPRMYQRASVFVLPSLVEGHPKALLEAMSCGLPVVASFIPGCTDVITDGVDGLLIEPTVKGIREGLRRLISDWSFARKLGQQARKTVVRRFEKQRILELEVQLMNTLV